MPDSITIHAELRGASGKGVARKLRAHGKIPGVVYGRRMETVPVVVDLGELSAGLKTHLGANVLIQLDVPGSPDLGGKTVMVRELQRDPLSHLPVHADFIEVRMDELVRVEVPLRFTGRPKGVEEGGVLQELHRTLEVECMPTAIPEFIACDVADLMIGGVLHLSQITLPEGARAVADTDLPLAHVLGARAEEEAVAKPAVEGEEAAAEGDEEKKEPEKDEKKDRKSDKK
jgi:large subunit ribosomal protein L25